MKLSLRPEELFARLYDTFENCFLLESAESDSQISEQTFLGFNPRMVISAIDGGIRCNDRRGAVYQQKCADPLSYLRVKVGQLSESKFRFTGGLVGYISYDSVRYWEKLPSSAKDSLFPDFEFGLYTDWLTFDHKKRKVYYSTYGDDNYELVKKVASQKREHSALSISLIHRPRKEEFLTSVKSAKKYIMKGDVFQVVLSKRYELSYIGDLLTFYVNLKKVNPSPYMFFLKFGDRIVIGSSPEMLVRVTGKYVETFPIAGTRPIGKDESETKKLAADLIYDEKERAEHMMLVDLARNDIGRISKFGSVEVPELMSVHRFSHVQHLVSHVRGELLNGYDSFDALRYLFPAGTVSGAPKPRAMEIIDELEPVRRGPYAGAVGYFSLNGNCDFAITIRTAVINGNRCYVQSGAGIVADSVPEKEWDETEAKASAIFNALKLSGGAESRK